MTDTRSDERVAQAEMGDLSNTGKEVATSAPRDNARAQQLKNLRDGVLADVEAHRGDLTQILNATGGDYETFVAGLRIFMMRTMQDNASFFEGLTAVSFMEALMRCARDGLVPDGKEAAISAFKDRKTGRRRATYMPMRDGFVKVLWRTGLISDLNDQIVTRAEEEAGRFEYEEGDDGFIRHRPLLSRKDTDPVVAAYCVIHMKGGGVMREVVMSADLEKIRKISQGDARKNWPHQMDRKAAIRRIMGKMPREKAIAQVLAHDEENYDLSLAAPARQPSGVAARLTAQRDAAVATASRPGFALGTVDAALNPLAPESLDEVLGGDDVPSFADAETEPEAEDDRIKAGVEGLLQGDDDFPGDKPAAPFDAFGWADAMRRVVASAPSVEVMDLITNHPTFGPNMVRLRETSAGGAKALEAAINGRRKALADKERAA
jgi:recombinational DNA repair protein RecT